MSEKGRQADGKTDRRTKKVKGVELRLDFKVLGRYDCSSHLRSGWGRRKTSGGRPIIICPTCRCDLVIFVRKPCFERSRRDFCRGGGEMKEKRKRQGRKERRSQEKKMGGWGGVSRTTVKWLRCYHGDSNEGSQDTLGVCRRRRRGLGRGGGGRRESDGEEDWGEQKLKGGEGENVRGLQAFFFLFLIQADYVDTHYVQCCHGNVPCDALLTSDIE